VKIQDPKAENTSSVLNQRTSTAPAHCTSWYESHSLW